jgi:hypothetical protein
VEEAEVSKGRVHRQAAPSRWSTLAILLLRLSSVKTCVGKGGRKPTRKLNQRLNPLHSDVLTKRRLSCLDRKPEPIRTKIHRTPEHGGRVEDAQTGCGRVEVAAGEQAEANGARGVSVSLRLQYQVYA